MTESASPGGYDSFYVLGLTTFHVAGADEKELFHRTDGPAVVEHRGSKEWWVEGKRHRLDGPAVEAGEAEGREDEWWIDGERYSAETHARIVNALSTGAPLTWAIAFAEGRVW